ncbi:MAG: hypothetical protein U0U67_16450 [Chitinophagales bacterium]
MQLLHAQSKYLVVQKDAQVGKIKAFQKFKNENELQQYLSNLQQQYIAKGYLEFSIDSTQRKSDSLIAFLHVGEQYEIKNKQPSVKKRKNNAVVNSVYAINTNKESILKSLENNGYPFAKVTVDSVVLNDKKLEFQYKIEKGKLITVDSFKNFGNSKITKGFIQNYVQIKSKKPYNESKVLNIDKQLQKLPYAELTAPTQILFRDDKADLHLFLKKRKVNSFDFLIGFLPGSNRGKILITGEVRIHLQNSFKRGEEIFLEWKKLQRQSQLLDVRFNYPFFLNAPIGINFTFNLEKRDSSSLDLAWQLGLPYITKSNNYVKGFYKYFQTIILAADTTFAKTYRKLPNNLDATYNQYGLQAYYENLDYLFNPRKGFDAKLTASIGTKKIKPSNQITSLVDPFDSEFQYSSLYDSVKRKSIKGDLFWSGNYYLPLGKKQRQILKFSINGGSVFNQNLLRNELLRIGGNKLLRGFDEQSIFASTYNVATVEYRYMIQRNSYFFVFFDAAYVHRKFNNTIFQDVPFGFGAGLTFATKIGIFGLTYALGQQKDKKIDFRSSKLHFGYVATF